MSKEVKKIVNASWHRNGISGAGFYAVLFEHKDEGLMIASIFDKPGYCAVFKVALLAEGDIEFANSNSWRGDIFERQLRPMVKEFLEKNKTNRVGPFAF